MQAVAAADVVITMLPDGSQVSGAYLGGRGVIGNARLGAILIDSSTIDVATARAVATAASEDVFQMLVAPVSGGAGGAVAGSLAFMVGGERSAFECARPFLAAMGKNIFHAGASGDGQVAKIANNMLLGVTMIAICGAFNLAEKLGLDALTFLKIASTASGQSWSMTSYCPAPGPVPSAPSNRGYAPGFAAS